MRILPLALLALLPLGLAASGEEKQPAPWFVNVAKEVGLTGARAKDCIFTELNGDGYLDLCLDKQRLYLSEKGERFVLHEESGIEFPEVFKVPMTKGGRPDLEKAKKGPYVPQYLYFADLDNDGDRDAVWGVHSSWEHFDGRTWHVVPECDPEVRSTVWLNDGRGKFKAAKRSGFSGRGSWGPAMALAIVDYDLDGNLDLYEGREYRQYGQTYGCGVDRLWRGDGKGRFTDVTEKAGLLTVPKPGGPRSSRPTYGVTHADVNNDGWPDLLQLAYGRQWNYLWLNDGDGTFTEAGRETGFAGDDITHGRYPEWVKRATEKPFRANGNTFDCAVGDYDNDGDLDLFLGEIQHAWAGDSSDPPSLLENLGEEAGYRFRRHPVGELLPPRKFRDPKNFNYGDLHVAFVDVDNDGRLDLLIGSGDYPDGQFLRLYRQKADGSFSEATEAAGFDWEGCGDLSLGDFDRDGDVDILAGRSFMRLNKAHRDRFMGGIAVNEVGLFRNDVANRSGNH
ncbi:MAG: FG-GAP repeat domain-containing protein, partial [Planctomycetota bacterium]